MLSALCMSSRPRHLDAVMKTAGGAARKCGWLLSRSISPYLSASLRATVRPSFCNAGVLYRPRVLRPHRAGLLFQLSFSRSSTTDTSKIDPAIYPRFLNGGRSMSRHVYDSPRHLLAVPYPPHAATNVLSRLLNSFIGSHDLQDDCLYLVLHAVQG